MYLRMLAEKKKDHWLATCLELNLVALGDTSESAFNSLKDAIEGHISAVMDTEDHLSIPRLLNRPASFKKRVIFHLAQKLHMFKRWKPRFLPENFQAHAHA